MADSPTPWVDAEEVDLQECIKIETSTSGTRRYVTKYVSAKLARSLERLVHQQQEMLQEVCSLEPDISQGLFESGRSQGLAEAQHYAIRALAAYAALKKEIESK